MGRGIHILWAGRHHRSAWESLCASYRERIAHHGEIVDRPVQVRGKLPDDARRRQEGEALIAALPEPCWLIAMDVGGKSMSSERLAARLADIEHDWPHAIAFAIGSDLGLEPTVIQRAKLVLGLGPMTLGHELARLVLYEQIYRARAIANGIKYHRPRL